MNTKIASGLIALCGLATLVGFAGSSQFIDTVVKPLALYDFESYFEGSQTSREQLDRIISDAGHERPRRRSESEVPPAQPVDHDIPDGMFWHMVFDFTKKMIARGDEANLKGERGSLYLDYFRRQGPLSPENDLILKQKALEYSAEIEPIENRATVAIGESRREASDSLFPRLNTLQEERDEVSLRLRSEFKESLGAEAFSEFEDFVKKEFSKGAFNHRSDPSYAGGFFYDGISVIIWDDTSTPSLITGFSELYFYYLGPPYYWDPYLESYFVNASTQQVLDSGYSFGLEDFYPATFDHRVYISSPGQTYCTVGDHYSYFWPDLLAPEGWRFDFLATTAVCHTVSPLPTPTPTPPFTPTPTPTPSPDPCDPAAGLPCATPTPTPVPSPTVTISAIEVVEKYGEMVFRVTVVNNPGGTTFLRIKTAAGTTGAATFIDGSTQMAINGNVTDQQVTLKGLTESSQKDNMTIDATVNGSASVVTSQNFTVGLIAELYFEKFDAASSDILPNPGNGQPGSQEGQRVFPDRNTPTDATVDRALIKVVAKVLPVGAGLKVHFGSYDLDDPSTNSLPIDRGGSDGNDNRGLVNASISGDFEIPTGYNCDPASRSTGSAPSWVSKVRCTTQADGLSTAAFKTTMQPGDNFTVSASLSADYRDAINIDSSAGTRIINSMGLPIHISLGGNPDQTAGIRTEMLTVWRRLHLEIDNMSPAQENYVAGSISGGFTLGSRRTRTINVSAGNLDENRFADGRLVVASISDVLVITSNTGNTLSVVNSSNHNITLANNVNVELANVSGLSRAVGMITNGQTIPAAQSATLTFAGRALNNNAFSNGEVLITPVLKSFSVSSNTSTTLTIENPGAASQVIPDTAYFRLYDDDDYNRNDTGGALDGDENELMVRFPDVLRHLSENLAGGNYPDGTPVNILASSYILPEYHWAENVMHYNDSVPPFDVNIDGLPDVMMYENVYQGSAFSERDDFWIGYFLISYQGQRAFDHDGSVSGVEEGSEVGLTGVSSSCDCLGVAGCPRPGLASLCSGPPVGGNITFIYLETLNDQGRDNMMFPNWTIPDSEVVAPHELGHQFGLLGDQPGSQFFVMDYPNNSASPPSRVQFHPEHINIMRARVRSPGR